MRRHLHDRTVVADNEAVYWAAVEGAGPPDPDGRGEITTELLHRIMKLAK